MKIAVCLSSSRHPVSNRPALARLEAQAIGLGSRLRAEVVGLHCGQEDEALREALGVGLRTIDRIAIAPDADPVPAMAEYFGTAGPDLILCGRRGQGGLDTGLLPYLLADRLGLPLIADAVAIELHGQDGHVQIDQGLKRGDRRRMIVRLPAVVTVHPLAPPAPTYAFAASRRGTIRDVPVSDRMASQPDASPFTERPFRARPKLMRTAGTATGSAAEKLHVHPEPEEAARLILDYLERNGIRSFGAPKDPSA